MNTAPHIAPITIASTAIPGGSGDLVVGNGVGTAAGCGFSVAYRSMDSPFAGTRVSESRKVVYPNFSIRYVVYVVPVVAAATGNVSCPIVPRY
jgi:hypothetical protein